MTPETPTQPALAAGQVWVPGDGASQRLIADICENENGTVWLRWHEAKRNNTTIVHCCTDRQFRAWIAKHDAKLEGG